MQNILYQPYYCEENIWQLAKQLDEKTAEVWFIINPNMSVATAHQKAVEKGAIIVWDYHVIYYSPARGIFDPDSRCPFPCLTDQYLKSSFLEINDRVPPAYHPCFRIILAKEYLALFASTREHMKDSNGDYLQPLPNWPAIGEGNNLSEFTDYQNKQYGRIFSLKELARQFVSSSEA